MGFHIDVNTLRVTRIKSIVTESLNVKTFYFEDEHASKGGAGQFLMVWVPGIDEVPMSISSTSLDGLASITVKKVGEATDALHSMRNGDLIGIRGPYGMGFKPQKGNIVLVAGGVGVAPLYPLLTRLNEVGSNITMIMGFKSRREIIFLDRVRKILTEEKIIVTTEDGSYGLKGLATSALTSMLRRSRFDMIYASGPEKMLLEVYKLSKEYKTPVQMCLERYIRCGMGICGSCCLGRYLVCRDGPVFSSEQLLEVGEELGKFKLDPAGRKIAVDE
ncbi:MAG: dihydroorotate dehydrogenase electron transfer subunit [Candidatus Bathyarchaeia archaeon]